MTDSAALMMHVLHDWGVFCMLQADGEALLLPCVVCRYWPEAPAFADTINGSVVYGPPPQHFRGSCPPGEAFTGCK